MSSTLESHFNDAMHDIYKEAKKECNYNATRFLQMLSERGGLQTARTLIRTSRVSEIYIALWERNRLDLTVENLMLQPQWSELFTEEELKLARQRLAKYGFTVA